MDYFRTQSLSTYGFLSGYHCVLSFLEKVKHRDLLTRAVVYNSLARQLDSNILKARRLVTTAFAHSPTSDGCVK